MNIYTFFMYECTIRFHYSRASISRVLGRTHGWEMRKNIIIYIHELFMIFKPFSLFLVSLIFSCFNGMLIASLQLRLRRVWNEKVRWKCWLIPRLVFKTVVVMLEKWLQLKLLMARGNWFNILEACLLKTFIHKQLLNKIVKYPKATETYCPEVLFVQSRNKSYVIPTYHTPKTWRNWQNSSLISFSICQVEQQQTTDADICWRWKKNLENLSSIRLILEEC